MRTYVGHLIYWLQSVKNFFFYDVPQLLPKTCEKLNSCLHMSCKYMYIKIYHNISLKKAGASVQNQAQRSIIQHNGTNKILLFPYFYTSFLPKLTLAHKRICHVRTPSEIINLCCKTTFQEPTSEQMGRAWLKV